jgi:hypothetical protein
VGNDSTGTPAGGVDAGKLECASQYNPYCVRAGQ